MAACMMFKEEVKSSLESRHVTEEKNSSIDHVSRGRDSSTTFAEKILAKSHSQPKKVTMRVRVAKVRAQGGRRFRDGFEKVDLTEQEVEDRRHALAQKLIAKTLKQADRRRYRRRRLKIRLPLRFPRWNVSVASFSPLVSCFRWLRPPFLRLARMASLAASRVELNRKRHPSSCRVRCFP